MILIVRRSEEDVRSIIAVATSDVVSQFDTDNYIFPKDSLHAAIAAAVKDTVR